MCCWDFRDKAALASRELSLGGAIKAGQGARISPRQIHLSSSPDGLVWVAISVEYSVRGNDLMPGRSWDLSASRTFGGCN